MKQRNIMHSWIKWNEYLHETKANKPSGTQQRNICLRASRSWLSWTTRRPRLQVSLLILFFHEPRYADKGLTFITYLFFMNKRCYFKHRGEGHLAGRQLLHTGLAGWRMATGSRCHKPQPKGYGQARAGNSPVFLHELATISNKMVNCRPEVPGRGILIYFM